MEYEHIPVLAKEVIFALDVRAGLLVLDGTLGRGGHAKLCLDAGASVIGLDRDPSAVEAARVRLAKFGERFRGVVANFRDSRAVLDRLGIDRVDRALVDLGVSSPQLDEAVRGFSFRVPGPLDMRMGPDAERLDHYLARVDENELARVIRVYGEDRFARMIARAIKRELPEIADTVRLANVIANAIPRKAWPSKINPATKTFQALRIAINDELGALKEWLASIPSLISRGGRAAVISFHSLEDRMVKQAFAELARSCRCPPELPECRCAAAPFRLLTKKPVVPAEEEIIRNPRARSAKLRAVERL